MLRLHRTKRDHTLGEHTLGDHTIGGYVLCVYVYVSGFRLCVLGRVWWGTRNAHAPITPHPSPAVLCPVNSHSRPPKTVENDGDFLAPAAGRRRGARGVRRTNACDLA